MLQFKWWLTYCWCQILSSLFSELIITDTKILHSVIMLQNKKKMGKHSIRNEIEKKKIHKCIKMKTLIYIITWIASVRVWIALSSKVFPIKWKQRGVLFNICGDEKVEQRKSKCTILVPYCSSDLVKKSIAPNTSSLHLQMSTIFIEESNNSIELFSNYSWK